MRLLLLNQYFNPDVAASGQRFAEVADALAAAHDVTAVVARPSYGRREHDLGGRFTDSVKRPPRSFSGRVRRVWSTRLSRYRPWARLLNYLSYLAAAFVAGVFTRRPDAVVAATDPPVVGLVGLAVGRLRRAPLVYLLWDIHPEATLAAGIMRDGLVTRATAWANRLVLERAAAVVVPTAAMGRTAVELGAPEDRVSVIPHWEDTDVVRPEPKDNAFSRRFALVDRFVLMYSGNLGLTQGLDRYVDLAAHLADLSDFTLVFVGDGAAKPFVERRAQSLRLESVRFLPYQPRDDMRLSLAAADVLIAPSLAGLSRYMLPSKVYTFMASGRPFIAAIDPACDLADTIRDIGCGRVVHPDDDAGIEREVRWFHAHPAERAEMGRRGREAAEARFSRHVVPARYLALVESLGIRSS